MTTELIKVLLVEDNPGDAYLVRELLEDAVATPFEVSQAELLAGAVSRLGQEKVEVLLLDLSLPDAQGLEGVRTLRVAAPHVPMVVLTGQRDEELALKALREGAKDYLVKDQINGPLLVRALRYARERQHAEDQLCQARKMEAVGQLAGGIAHDINNMMMVVTGFSEVLLQSSLGEARQRETVEEIKKAAERVTALTRQLLAFSRKQVLCPVVLNLNDVVTGMEQMLRFLVHTDITMTFELSPALRSVKADPGQMEQVLLNLALNAADAMPEGGRLFIETANVEPAEAFRPPGFEEQPGPLVRLAVRDTGCGMDKATRARLFEPFFTTKEVGKGTGLGLAMVYGIVQQSGGQILVDTTPGVGTTFTIYLPAVSEPADVPPAEPSPFSAHAPGAETILLVEDQPGVRMVIRLALEDAGYTVLESGDGANALRIAEQYAGPIHLLITDSIMPGMNGRELRERMLALRPDVKVLCISGYSDKLLAEHGAQGPGVAFLAKPFTPDTLQRKLQEILAQPPTSA